MGVTRKQRTPNFLKHEHFSLPDTHTCVCVSGGKKCSFFGKFGVLCFLVTPVLRFAIFLIADELVALLCLLLHFQVDVLIRSRGVFRTLSNKDGFYKNSTLLKVVNYFCKTLHLRSLKGSEYACAVSNTPISFICILSIFYDG